MIRWEFLLYDESTTDSLVISEPEGVKELILNINRDEDKHGIYFENSLNEITFYGLAAEFVRDRYELQRTDANVRFDIMLYCEDEADDSEAVPETIQAKIDFKSFKDKCGIECAVTVGLEQTGCINMLQARMDTKVDLAATTDLSGAALPATTNIDFLMPLPARDLFLINESEMEDLDNDGTPEQWVQDDLAASTDWFDNTVPQGMTAWLFPAQPVMKNAGLGEFTVYPTSTLVNGGFANRPDPDTMYPTVIFSQPAGILCEMNDVEVSFDLVGLVTQYEVSGTPLTTLTVKLMSFAPGGDPTNAGDYVTHYSNVIATLNGDEGPVSINESVTVTIPGVVEGTLLWYGITVICSDTDQVDQLIFLVDGQSRFQSQALVQCEASTHKVSMIHESMSRVLQSITEQCMPYVRSDFYGRPDSTWAPTADNDGCGSLRVILNGLKLRKAELDKHFISFRELFDWLNAMDNIGMSIEVDVTDGEYVRIEDVEFFYDSATEIFELTSIPEAVKNVDTKKIYSKISVGYKEWETGFTAGLDETNSNREYRTSLKYINNELPILSGFIAGSYAIEQARRESFALTGQADTTYDNNTFIICVKRDDDDIVVEHAITTAVNMLPGWETAVNARISPVRNLLRWFKSIIHCYAHPEVDDKIYFSAGTGNYIAGTTITRINCTLEEDSVDLFENQTIEYEDFYTAYLGYDDPAATKEWQPVIQPETIVFEYPMTVKMYKQIKASPYGYILYTCGIDGTPTKGFIKSIKYAVTEGTAQFELIPKFVFV